MRGPCELTGRYSVVHNGPLVYVSDAGQPGDGEANARLISASPDLLAALQWITRCASIDGPAGTTAYLISDERMAAARAAIAKATGVQP